MVEKLAPRVDKAAHVAGIGDPAGRARKDLVADQPLTGTIRPRQAREPVAIGRRRDSQERFARAAPLGVGQVVAGAVDRLDGQGQRRDGQQGAGLQSLRRRQPSRTADALVAAGPGSVAFCNARCIVRRSVRVIAGVPETVNASGSFTEVIVKWNMGVHTYYSSAAVATAA